MKGTERVERPGPGPVVGRLARAAPIVGAVGVAYCLARFAPYWVIGVNRWLWWFGVFAIANTCLVLGDSLRVWCTRRIGRRVRSTPIRGSWPPEAGRGRRGDAR